MTTEDIIEYFGIEEPILFFKPEEVFNKGIIGITEDHCHIVYGYWELVTALAEDYERLWNKEEHSAEEEKPDFYTDAMEWLDINTIRSLSYEDQEICPIVIYELPAEEKIKGV